ESPQKASRGRGRERGRAAASGRAQARCTRAQDGEAARRCAHGRIRARAVPRRVCGTRDGAGRGEGEGEEAAEEARAPEGGGRRVAGGCAGEEPESCACCVTVGPGGGVNGRG